MSSFRWRRRSVGTFGSLQERSTGSVPELIEGYAHICFDRKSLWFRGNIITHQGSSYNLSGKRSTERDADVAEAECDGPSTAPILDPAVGSPSQQQDDKLCLSGNRITGELDSPQLQFALEEFPGEDHSADSPIHSVGSLSVSSAGSPVETRRMMAALDHLFVDEESPFGCHDATHSRSRSTSRSSIVDVYSMFDITVCDLEEGTQHSIRNVTGMSGQSCTLRNKHFSFVTEKAFRGQKADMVIQRDFDPQLVEQGCHVFAGPVRFHYKPLMPVSSSLTNNWCW